MISREITIDILQYLQDKKELTTNDIAKSMETSSEHIQNIIDKKELFKEEDIQAYLKTTNISLWEFAYKAIIMDHLSDKSRKRILLCKELSKRIKKNKNT